MSRPKPTVLVEITDKTTYKTEQVLASDGIWAVYFDSNPINLKTSNILVHGCSNIFKVFDSHIYKTNMFFQKCSKAFLDFV